MPLYFWDDPDGQRYHDAYFAVYPGVWRHGDYVLIHSDTGGVTFFGRSDAVLKPSGVRIGTAEIYNQVEQLPEIADSLAIGQDWQGDQRILLFVKLAPGDELTDELEQEDREDPPRERLTPPRAGQGHRRRRHPLHPERQEGGDGGDEHPARPPGDQPGLAREPGSRWISTRGWWGSSRRGRRDGEEDEA